MPLRWMAAGDGSHAVCSISRLRTKLGISEETVKVHRGHAMRKLEIDSVPSLVRLLDRAAC